MSALKLLAMCQWLRKPFRTIGNIKKKKETEVSLRSTNFVLHMYQQLTSEQRYVISALLKRKVRKNEIAKEIGVSLSTVYREIKRNSNSRGGYSPGLAHEMAMERRERIITNSSVKPDVKREALRLLTTEQWSPKQISGYLAQQGKHISHEKIYQVIREDKSGELAGHTRHGMKYRHHTHQIRPTKATNIPNRVSIHERPAEANGSRFGDWEMDLIIGREGKGAILVLAERKTNYFIMKKLPLGKKPEGVTLEVYRALLPYKSHVLTITTDNGSEFSDHQEIARLLQTKVYFADSYCSWQKGAVENTNKLIRQYIPKGADFNNFSEHIIMKIQKKINRRPREKLNFSTPKDEFFNLIN